MQLDFNSSIFCSGSGKLKQYSKSAEELLQHHFNNFSIERFISVNDSETHLAT